MKQPTFEEYTRPVQTLKNGKTFVVAEQLAETRRQYELTRRTYNLMRKNSRGRTLTIYAGSEPRTRAQGKYTISDWQWMQDRSPQEIADRYGISAKQAYGVKHYVRQQFSVG